MQSAIRTFFILAIFHFAGCKQEKPVTCADLTLSLNLTKTDITQNPPNGTILAEASGGEGFIYSIGSTTNSTGKFENLAAGTYTVVAKNSIGCSISKVVTLESITPDNSCTNNNINIKVSSTPASPCSAGNGTISITAGGSSGFSYKLNNGAFQNSNQFGNLAAGTYTATVKDLNGCTKSQSVSIAVASEGPNFTNVRNIIKTNCGGCHLNGGSSGGVNYDNDCSIVTGWNRINEECVIRSTMPPGRPLSSDLKAQISAWVKAGHKYTD